MPTAEILSQGDEVVTGQVADTNAAWLSERLVEAGFAVVRHTAVGDVLADIVGTMREAAARSDLVIGTGGLGPTDDDLTAEAVALAFERPLALDDEALRQIEAMFARFGRTMAAVNRKQAMLPHGSRRLDNAWGTAPGFAFEQGKALFAFVPGVPREMKPMWEQRLWPLVKERWSLAPGRLVTIRTTGIGESDLQTRIGSPRVPGVTVGYRTILPENHVKLRADASVTEADLRALVDDLVARIGTSVFAVEGLGEPGGSLAQVVARALVARGETLAIGESCTGGRVAALCTEVPGSSAWFLEGVVTYANAAKVRLLGVDPQVIADHGAVSEPVAVQMAEGARSRAGATWGLGITGIAGPDGGTDEKPVGTVHVALAEASASSAGEPGVAVHHRKLRLFGDRAQIQARAATAALDVLRRRLQDQL